MEQVDDATKVKVFDKLMRHAEAIEKKEWLEGTFLPTEVRQEIEGHALYFLKVARSALKQIQRQEPSK